MHTHSLICFGNLSLKLDDLEILRKITMYRFCLIMELRYHVPKGNPIFCLQTGDDPGFGESRLEKSLCQSHEGTDVP